MGPLEANSSGTYKLLATAAGKAGSSRPTGRMPGLDSDFAGFAGNLDNWLSDVSGLPLGYRHLGRLSRCASPAPPPFSRASAPRRLTTATRRRTPPTSIPRKKPRRLFDKVRTGKADARMKRVQFRAQMLTEMARMSLDDGLVLQIHPGAWRNHSPGVQSRLSAAARASISPPPPTMSAR